MSDWATTSLTFDPFGPLKPPLQSTLQFLETIEAILEALLDLVKVFLLDLLNPVKAVVALLLAAIRTIINQLKSTGFSILLVHPDFSRQDVAAVFQSVSGSYPAFESKVFGKFHDTSDLFRPTYPKGSSVAMLALYIGQESPSDLMVQLMSLLNFIKHPKVLSGLPAPTDLKVRPALKSDDPTAIARNVVKNFGQLFGGTYEKALVLEWRMPSAPTGSQGPGFINQFSTFLNSFRFPSFVVERSATPTGEAVIVALKTQTTGPAVTGLMKKFDFPPPASNVELREENGSVYRNFADARVDVSGARLAEGFTTGTYRYVDNDPVLVEGRTYYYRVRAYAGNPKAWFDVGVKASGADPDPDALQDLANSIGSNQTLVKSSGNQKFIRFGDNVVMGQPGPIVKGFVPKSLASYGGFNPYDSVYDAVKAALLLNFEFPPAVSGDSAIAQDQKTGWGTLSAVGGQIGALKRAEKDAVSLSQNILFKTTARRIANNTLTAIQSSPKLIDLILSKWNTGVQETVVSVLGDELPTGSRVPSINWKFIGVSGNGSASDQARISAYLAKEAGYKDGVPLDGPFPTLSAHKDGGVSYVATVEQRKALADFLRTCLSLNGSASYLSWYSVTVADLFPAFIPFIFDFEQFLKALLKALQSVTKEIESIIETVIQKIQQLESILRTIVDILGFLKISIKLSVLGVSSSSGSADSLASALLESEQKPFDSPFGLHSGLVMTFGGPGAGFTAAFKALAFVLTLNHF